MGCTSSDGGYSKESTKDNINFLVEICSSWGYQQRQTAVKEFVEYLQTNGYKQINVDFVAKGGGKGEFFVSLKKENFLLFLAIIRSYTQMRSLLLL